MGNERLRYLSAEHVCVMCV